MTMEAQKKNRETVPQELLIIPRAKLQLNIGIEGEEDEPPGKAKVLFETSGIELSC
jgi:hypothetical protein